MSLTCPWSRPILSASCDLPVNSFSSPVSDISLIGSLPFFLLSHASSSRTSSAHFPTNNVFVGLDPAPTVYRSSLFSSYLCVTFQVRHCSVVMYVYVVKCDLDRLLIRETSRGAQLVLTSPLAKHWNPYMSQWRHVLMLWPSWNTRVMSPPPRRSFLFLSVQCRLCTQQLIPPLYPHSLLSVAAPRPRHLSFKRFSLFSRLPGKLRHVRVGLWGRLGSWICQVALKTLSTCWCRSC